MAHKRRVFGREQHRKLLSLRGQDFLVTLAQQPPSDKPQTRRQRFIVHDLDQRARPKNDPLIAVKAPAPRHNVRPNDTHVDNLR